MTHMRPGTNATDRRLIREYYEHGWTPKQMAVKLRVPIRAVRNMVKLIEQENNPEMGVDYDAEDAAIHGLVEFDDEDESPEELEEENVEADDFTNVDDGEAGVESEET
jgi:hypothetical protein